MRFVSRFHNEAGDQLNLLADDAYDQGVVQRCSAAGGVEEVFSGDYLEAVARYVVLAFGELPIDFAAKIEEARKTAEELLAEIQAKAHAALDEVMEAVSEVVDEVEEVAAEVVTEATAVVEDVKGRPFFKRK